MNVDQCQLAANSSLFVSDVTSRAAADAEKCDRSNVHFGCHWQPWTVVC